MSAVDGDDGPARRFQIGEVVERVGLSASTIRTYEELGILPQSCRSAGGFRLYVDADIDRLRFIKRFRPLGFTLDEVRMLMESLDALGEPPSRRTCAAADQVELLCGVLEERCAQRRLELAAGEATVELLSRMASPVRPARGRSALL